MTAFVWTDPNIATLKRLWLDGLTTREIGAVMGITKNAVIGKCARLGLADRAPVKRKTCALDDLTNDTCRWPIGDPLADNFHFCGAQADLAAGRSYCAAHHRLAYQPSMAGLKRPRGMRDGTAKADPAKDREPDLTEMLA